MTKLFLEVASSSEDDKQCSKTNLPGFAYIVQFITYNSGPILIAESRSRDLVYGDKQVDSSKADPCLNLDLNPHCTHIKSFQMVCHVDGNNMCNQEISSMN